VRRHPVHAQHVPDGQVEIQFFLQLAAQGGPGRLVGFGHAAGQVPVRLVRRVDEQDAPLGIADEGVGRHPLAGLPGVR
jgi:hypothetical protein